MTLSDWYNIQFLAECRIESVNELGRIEQEEELPKLNKLLERIEDEIAHYD